MHVIWLSLGGLAVLSNGQTGKGEPDRRPEY